MPEESFVPLPGSTRRPLPAAEAAGRVDESEVIAVTVMTRRRAGLRRDASGTMVRISREELELQHGADQADLDRVTVTLARFGLETTSQDAASRQVKLAGTVAALSAAFGAELSLVTSQAPGGQGPVTHRYRVGSLRIPAELDGIVIAVLGLDNRPQARYQSRRAAPERAATSYTPPRWPRSTSSRPTPTAPGRR